VSNQWPSAILLGHPLHYQADETRDERRETRQTLWPCLVYIVNFFLQKDECMHEVLNKVYL